MRPVETCAATLLLCVLGSGCKTPGSQLLKFEDTVLGEKDIQRLNEDFEHVMIRPRNPFHHLPFNPAAGPAYADPDKSTYLTMWNLYKPFVDVTVDPPVMNKYKIRLYMVEETPPPPLNDPSVPSYMRRCAETTCTEVTGPLSRADVVAETACELDELFKAQDEYRDTTAKLEDLVRKQPPAVSQGGAAMEHPDVAPLRRELETIRGAYERRSAKMQDLQACWQRIHSQRSQDLQLDELHALVEQLEKGPEQNPEAWPHIRQRVDKARAKQCPAGVKQQSSHYLTYDLMNYLQPNLARNLLVQARMGTLDGTVLQGFGGTPATLAAERTAPLLFVAGSGHNVPETFRIAPDRYYTVKQFDQEDDLSRFDPAQPGVALPEADPGDIRQSRDHFGSPFSRGMLIGLAQNDTDIDLTKTILGTKFAIANIRNGTELVVYRRAKALPVSFGWLRAEQGDPKSLSVNQGIEHLAGAYWEGMQVKILCAEICPANKSRFVKDGAESPVISENSTLDCNWDDHD